MAGEIMIGVFAFLGAGIGSAIASWATLRAAAADRDERRRANEGDRQDRRREEWGRRFSDAISAVTSTDRVSRATGRALLRDLLDSELVTEDDRSMAVSVLDAAATGRANPQLVTPADLDDIIIVRESRVDDEEEGSR